MAKRRYARSYDAGPTVAHLFQVQKRATDFGALFAALVIVLIPTIVIYLLGQQYLLKGISAGGVKE